MRIEAIPRSCWSGQHVLKLDGRAWGEYSGRWFSENIEIHLKGRLQLSLEKVGWLGSRFALTDATDGLILAEADRAGVFTSAWDMMLSNGPGRLVSAGWFDSGYRVVQHGRTSAEVDRLGLCRGGWTVEGDRSFRNIDLLFIGLIYHAILSRNAASSST